LLGVIGSFGSSDDTDNSNSNVSSSSISAGTENSSSNDSDSSISAETEDKPEGTIGDYVCVVKSATLCKDYAGKDAVLITYEFTNNSSDAISFDVALKDSVYQDGIGLETAILDEDTDLLVDVDIKPGITKEVKKAYELRDTSTPLEIEVSELISLSDDKLVTKVYISK
jgi:hypothetical protein